MNLLRISLVVVTLTGLFVAAAASAQHYYGGTCSTTSRLAYQACQSEASKDYKIAKAKCLNLSDKNKIELCLDESQANYQSSGPECYAQFSAREKICKTLGQNPYDPVIDPANFVDPIEIGKSIAPNPLMPLIAGRTWVYKNETENEIIEKKITYDTKTILGVKCVVLHDVVKKDGVVIEDTIDWIAQDKDGNVWYFGEIAKNYENGELKDLEGSWKAGVDGAKPGIIMKARPKLNELYRQEFFISEAEDMGKILSLTGSASVPAAECNQNCLVTEDFTPLDPESIEHKYYKPGVGFILEIKPETGERVELVEIRNE